MSVRETALLLVHLAGVYGHCDRADFFEQGCLPYSIILHLDRNNYTARRGVRLRLPALAFTTAS